jgi:uridine kinase
MSKCTNLEIAIERTTDMINWFRETSPETPALQKTLVVLEGQLTLLNKELEKCLA